jgi:ribonucleoside-diphosphate reductase alpha chain
MSETEKTEKPEEKIGWKRPGVLHGYTTIVKSGCGKLHVTVNFEGNKPVEVYARSSSSGGCEANTNCIGRIISRMLQLGCPVEDVLEQLHSTRCPTAMRNKEAKIDGLAEHAIFIKSCPDGIARAIEVAMKLRDHDDGKKH